MLAASRSGLTTFLMCCALLSPALYPLSYLALANHDYLRINGRGDTFRIAQYRLGGEVAASFYRPLEHVDRCARPDYWSPANPERTWYVEILELGQVEGLGGGICDINVEDIPLEIAPLADDYNN